MVYNRIQQYLQFQASAGGPEDKGVTVQKNFYFLTSSKPTRHNNPLAGGSEHRCSQFTCTPLS